MQKQTQEQFIFFLDDMLFRYEFFRKFTKLCKTKRELDAVVRLCFSYLYEMLFSIKQRDPTGYASIGFDLTDEELKALAGERHNSSHVPEDVEKYIKRSKSFYDLTEGEKDRLTCSVDILYKYYDKQLVDFPALAFGLREMHGKLSGPIGLEI